MSASPPRGRDERRVYIGNLNPDATERDLEDKFMPYGPLRKVWVARRPPGFAYITFENHDDAARCVKECDGIMILDKPIRCEWSSREAKEVCARPRVPFPRRGGPTDATAAATDPTPATATTATDPTPAIATATATTTTATDPTPTTDTAIPTPADLTIAPPLPTTLAIILTTPVIVLMTLAIAPTTPAITLTTLAITLTILAIAPTTLATPSP